jgi:hypothetical protein
VSTFLGLLGPYPGTAADDAAAAAAACVGGCCPAPLELLEQGDDWIPTLPSSRLSLVLASSSVGACNC